AGSAQSGPVVVRGLGKAAGGNPAPAGMFAVNRGPLGPGGVEAIVLMRRGENPSEVLHHIHEAVEEINTTRLPRGVQIVPIHDKTELVQNTLHTVVRVLSEGFVIVVTVLLVLLVSLRAALLTALTIPLSLLFALL